jgi:hypothetical protein
MDTPDGVDRDFWSQLANQLELLGLGVPEEYAPFFGTVALTIPALLAAADVAAATDLLPELVNGSTVAALAFTEEDGDWDPAATGQVVHHRRRGRRAIPRGGADRTWAEPMCRAGRRARPEAGTAGDSRPHPQTGAPVFRWHAGPPHRGGRRRAAGPRADPRFRRSNTAAPTCWSRWSRPGPPFTRPAGRRRHPRGNFPSRRPWPRRWPRRPIPSARPRPFSCTAASASPGSTTPTLYYRRAHSDRPVPGGRRLSL